MAKWFVENYEEIDVTDGAIYFDKHTGRQVAVVQPIVIGGYTTYASYFTSESGVPTFQTASFKTLKQACMFVVEKLTE